VASETYVAVCELMNRYAHGVDRRDWDMVRSCYLDDAWDNHGAYNGGVDGLIEWMQRRHEVIISSNHFISNVLARAVGADEVVSESYCITIQRFGADCVTAGGMFSSPLIAKPIDPGSVIETEVRCRFIDLICEDVGGWKIVKRTVAYDSMLVRILDRVVGFPDDWAKGTRDREDPFYRAMVSKNQW